MNGGTLCNYLSLNSIGCPLKVHDTVGAGSPSMLTSNFKNFPLRISFFVKLVRSILGATAQIKRITASVYKCKIN